METDLGNINKICIQSDDKGNDKLICSINKLFLFRTRS